MTSTGDDVEQIRRDIERTQSRLSSDVNAFAQKVSPGRILERRMDRVRELPDRARDQVRGNPIAAGMVAIGVGWLVSSMLPSSRRERRLGDQILNHAGEFAEPVAGAAKQSAGEFQQELAGPARQAADAIGSATADARRTVVEEGRAATADIREQATEGARAVKRTAEG